MSFARLIDRCSASRSFGDSATVISGTRHTIDLRKLQTALLEVDREALSERRRRLNELYQEAKLDEEPSKGVGFQSVLLLLARYVLIDEREALTYVISRPSLAYFQSH